MVAVRFKGHRGFSFNDNGMEAPNYHLWPT